MNYQVVMNCGEPRFLGDRALLTMPSVGFLASRGEAALHGNLPLKSGEVILSGFLSPMERALFRVGLANRKPMIWVKPWALEEGIDSPPIRNAIEGGRLLILSPFASQIDAPSVRRAAWCNQYVLAHCNRMVVGHLTPGGMLACILSEAPADLEIVYLSSLSEEDVHGGRQSREMCETESQCQQVEEGRLSLPSEKNRREQANIKTGNIAY